MAEINLFIYKEGNSIIHKTHPTQKILFLILASFLITKGNYLTLIYFNIIILYSFFISKLSFYLLIKDLKYLIVLCFSIIIFQLLVAGDNIVETLIISLTYVLKIGMLILLGTIFTGTTRSEDITTGLYYLTRSKKVAQNVSLTISLIPTFLNSWLVIHESLESRGLKLIKNPFRVIFNITIPLLIETFKKSDSISIAMESRCYDSWIKDSAVDNKISIKIILLTILPFLLLIKMP